MAGTEITGKADFGEIRYAQLWEDADVLVQAFHPAQGARLVSICSAGDNALALLTLDPERVVALDISPAQIECLHLRMAAYKIFTHAEFLELMGAHASNRRCELLDRVIGKLNPTSKTFWKVRRRSVVAFGAGGVGKFERYFRIFRRWILSLVHSKKTIDTVFEPRNRQDREVFFRTRFNTWLWRLLIFVFFSRFTMGFLGRDKAFFDYVEGSVAAHVSRRVHHAGVVTAPSENPYLHWILKGHHGEALPLAWRAEHYETIRSRLDRLDIRTGSLEDFAASGERADGFNLSDIFEYMAPDTFARAYDTLLSAARPGARFVYWNMMVPRRVPSELAHRVKRLEEQENLLKQQDKAFFYSDFVIEEVLP